MRFIYPAMSFTPAAILLLVAGIFIRRRLYAHFPFFSAYIALSLTASGVRLLAEGQPSLYFRLYWATEAGYGILALLALNEVFRRLYELEYKDHRWFKFLIPTTTGIMLGFSVWGAIHHPPLHGHVRVMVRYIFWFDLGVHWLEAGILVLLIVLALFFTLPRGRYEFGILGGFAVSACVTVLVDLARSQLGRNYEPWFQYGPPLGYLLAALIWLFGFWHPPEPPGDLDLSNVRVMNEFLDRNDGIARKIAKALRRPGMRRQDAHV